VSIVAALLCAGAGVSASSQAATPATGALAGTVTSNTFEQGVHVSAQTEGQFDESLIPGYEKWLGHSVPLVEVFGDRSNESVLECPTYALDPETRAKKTVVISWDFFDTGNSANETWAQAAVGSNPTGTAGVSYDQRYKAFGQCLVDHGQKNAIVRVAQEFNNNSGSMPAVPSNDPVTIAHFKAAFQTFVTDMRSIPGAHFTFDYNPSIDPGNPTDLTFAYPGDAYVDVIGLDCYDAAIPYGDAWTTAADEWNRRLNGYDSGKGIAFYTAFAAAHHKPISFPEWGLGWYYDNSRAAQAPADDVYFITQMHAFMATHNVLYESFWEDHDRGLYSAISNPAPKASAAFRTLFGKH
jgi:hypothetical protein